MPKLVSAKSLSSGLCLRAVEPAYVITHFQVSFLRKGQPDLLGPFAVVAKEAPCRAGNQSPAPETTPRTKQINSIVAGLAPGGAIFLDGIEVADSKGKACAVAPLTLTVR